MAGTDKKILKKIDIDDINDRVLNEPENLIAGEEQRFDGLLHDVAQEIAGNVEHHRLVLLSGPSNAGKTTSSLKLCSMLKELGITAHTISMDDFFVDKVALKPDESGQYDYESPNCLNIELFASCMNRLLQNGEAKLPKYDFHTGKSERERRAVEITDRDIILVEGIHALNNIISDGIPNDKLFKIYLCIRSCFVHGGEIKLNKRDIRFIRRLVRDYKFRNSSAANTFEMWGGVVAGEEKYIKPFAAGADVFLDTCFAYEPAVTGEFAAPLLRELLEIPACREEAARLLSAVSLFRPMPPRGIPSSSLVREFIGGSKYYEDNVIDIH